MRGKKASIHRGDATFDDDRMRPGSHEVVSDKDTFRTGTDDRTKEPTDMYARVEKRAYEIYEERRRTGAPGDQFSDWITAEEEAKMRS